MNKSLKNLCKHYLVGDTKIMFLSIYDNITAKCTPSGCTPSGYFNTRKYRPLYLIFKLYHLKIWSNSFEKYRIYKINVHQIIQSVSRRNICTNYTNIYHHTKDRIYLNNTNKPNYFNIKKGVIFEEKHIANIVDLLKPTNFEVNICNMKGGNDLLKIPQCREILKQTISSFNKSEGYTFNSICDSFKGTNLDELKNKIKFF